MARAGMAKWRQGGGRGAPSSLTEGGDEVQRSLELLDRVLSEFDDLENGNIEGAGPGVVAPGIAQAAKVHPPPPSAAPPGGVGPQGPVVPPVPDRLPSGGGAAGGGSTPEDEEEEEDRSHQSEDDGYMSMNGRRMAPRPPAPRDEVQAPEVSGGEAGGRRAGDKVGRPPPNEDTPPPIPPLPSAAAPRSPPLPPLPPAAAQAGLALEDEDFPPPPEEAERIISTLLPRVTPGGGSGRHRGSGRGRLAGGWGSLGPPVGSPRPGLADLDPEMVAGCLVTTATQTTLPQTKHQRPYGWNVPFQPHPNATESVISAAVDIQKQRRRQHTAEGKPPPLPPLRFGSLPLDSRPVPPAPLPPRTLPGAGERHRVVRRRDEAHLQPTSTTALFEDGAPEARRRRGPGAADEEAFSDDSLEEAPRLAPPSPSASSTSPPGSDDGKRRSVAWEVSLEELDALAEEEGGGERACGSSEVAEMVPGSTKVVRGRSSRSRRSSSSDRSLGSSEPRSMDDRCGSWRGRRSASSASVGLHLSSNEEEYSGSGLEGGGEAAAELDEMATAADMAMLDDVEMTMATSQEGRGGPKGTYVIRKRRGRAGLGKADDKREDEEAKVAKNSLPGSPPTGDVSPTPECSLNSSPENEDKAPRVTPAPKTPERLPTTRPPKYFHGSRIPVLENSRIPILESSRALECRSPRSPRTPERASPMKNVIYLSGVQSRSPTSETSVTSAIEPHQVVVKITESGSSSMVMTGELEVRSPPPSPAHGANRPAELPELRKNSRPNTPFDRTPERRNAAGKLPPVPPPRTVTAQSVSKSSPSAVEPPETPPRTTPNAGVSSADEVGSRMCSFEASPAPPAPPNGLTETSSFEATPLPGEKTCTADALRETAVTVPVTLGGGQQSVEESGSPEAAPAPVQSPASEKKDRALKSPAPAVPRKNPAPQPPPRPLPRVLSLPAIAIGLTCDEEVEAIEESGVVEVAAEKMESVLEDKAVEEEYKKRVEAPKMEGEACVEAREERAEEATPVKEVVEELAIKEVEVEWTKKAAVVEEEGRKEEGREEEGREEEKGERDGREREVETKEQAPEGELGCLAEWRLPLQRSSTMPAVEEGPPRAIAPSASASSFPPLPPSPADEYCDVYDTFFFRKSPRLPPPDGPLPPSPPPDSPQPPPLPPHSMAFHRPREASLKSRSMDGGFPRAQRRTSGRRGGGEVLGERRTLPTELQGSGAGRRRRPDEGDRPLSPVPSPPPHAPAHLPPPRPQLPAPPTASPPETPVFSPRRGAPAADVPRRGHLYQRRGEPNGEACSMRHPSGAMTAGPASGHCSGYSLCGTAVSSTSSTASSSPFPGGLGPGRGWYPRHRHHAGAQQAATTTTAHHQHPAHNRPRPASTEHLDRLATASGPTAWDLHGYGPARAVVGGGAAALSGMCGPGVGARKPLTLPPNLTPKFFHRSPREALRRVTSLLIRKGSATKEAGRRDGAAGASGSVGVTSPTAAGPSSPPPAAAPGGSPDGTRTKRGFFKSFWKRSRHYSLEHQ